MRAQTAGGEPATCQFAVSPWMPCASLELLDYATHVRPWLFSASSHPVHAWTHGGHEGLRSIKQNP